MMMMPMDGAASKAEGLAGFMVMIERVEKGLLSGI
jgi:hypothetical protein